MIKLNIQEARTHLSRYIEEVEQGETILLCKRNQPVAEIRPLTTHPRRKRPVGLVKKIFSVPASFFEELPEATLVFFRGEVA